MCPTTKSSLNHVEMSPVETFFNVELRQKVVTCRRMEKFIDQVTQAQESIGTTNYNHLQMFTTREREDVGRPRVNPLESINSFILPLH